MTKWIRGNEAVTTIIEYAHPILSCGRLPPMRKRATKHLFDSVCRGGNAVT
jgi:hypothetical protein